jgi:hypothetical protein
MCIARLVQTRQQRRSHRQPDGGRKTDESVHTGVRTSGRWCLFALRTAFLGIIHVAVLLAVVVWS